MDINQLIEIVKKKIDTNIQVDDIEILDKTFLHLKHDNYKQGKFHLQIIIKSEKLKIKNRIEVSRQVHKILEDEIKKFIHSIQIKLI
tara:strand:+ start:313 stop:573 length:261 start_codon:yes stop_codon:yes gene_type:complete